MQVYKKLNQNIIDFLLIFAFFFPEILHVRNYVTVKDTEIHEGTFFMGNLILNIFYTDNCFLKIDICEDISEKFNFEVSQPPKKSKMVCARDS